MTEVFGATYSLAYDALYGDKDYAQECDLIEHYFDKYGDDGSTRSVLDLGCGTGGHAWVLADRGFQVVGVDRSPDMLLQAESKATGANPSCPPEWVCGDIRGIHVGKTFDAAVMMFAVLGYQLRNEDVTATLSTIRGHLRTGGLAVFDFWYGPGVLHDLPSSRTKEVPAADGRWRRVAKANLDVRHHRCTVEYRLERLCDDSAKEHSVESHEMRFFFPLEVESFLQLCGMKLLELVAFPNVNAVPDHTCWNALAVAKAV